MHPHPTKNGTPTLAPDLKRGTTAGMDRVDDNAHQDVTGRCHGTNQGPMIIIGRDRETSQTHLETKEGKAHGNSMETPGENYSPWSNQPKESMKKFTRFQADRAQTESTNEQKTPPCFDSQKLKKMMMKGLFQQKEEDWKWEKKEKPDLA